MIQNSGGSFIAETLLCSPIDVQKLLGNLKDNVPCNRVLIYLVLHLKIPRSNKVMSGTI